MKNYFKVFVVMILFWFPFIALSSNINGVFFKENCNWIARDIDQTGNVMALLYLSEGVRDSFGSPFMITIIVNKVFPQAENEGLHRMELEIDGKTHEAFMSYRQSSTAAVTQFGLMGYEFNRIDPLFRAGNKVSFKFPDTSYNFSLSGYTKTSNALENYCEKK